MKKEKIIKWLPVIWFVAISLLYIYLYATRINYLLDADMSSEMVLSDLLTREHGIMSKNWFYSTELRFLNNQLIFEFFLLFGHNYHISRVLSGITLMAILVLSYCYMLKNMGLKKYFFATAPVLMLPFSLIYSDIILLGLYYIPHISISFFSLGLIFAVENAKDSKSKKTNMIILGILSLLAGIGGPRQIIIFYLPVFLTGLLRWYITKSFRYMGIYLAFVCSAIGYVINSKVLIRWYKYNGWQGFKYTGFGSENLDNILQGFLNVLGFAPNDIFSFATIRTGGAFVLMFLALAYYIYFFKKIFLKIKNQENVMTDTEWLTGSFLLVATLIYIVIYLFTDMFYEDRYSLPFMVFLLPIMALSIENHSWKKLTRLVFMGCISLMILAMSLCVYKTFWFIDKTAEHRDITEFLLANGYNNGYATYWNANLITELSNGTIDSYVWTSSIENVADVDDLYRWLQVKSHKDNPPEGKVFIVFEVQEYNDSILQRYIGPANLVFFTDNYYVLGFENYESLITILSTYHYDLDSQNYIGTAEYGDGRWIYNPGELSGGPFTTLYKGSYTFTITGDNLDKASVSVSFDSDESEMTGLMEPDSVALMGDTLVPGESDGIIFINTENAENIKTYTFSIDENIHDFQLVIMNSSDETFSVDEITINRDFVLR